MLFIHQQIQSFLNLGACKEYPIMAKPRFPKKTTGGQEVVSPTTTPTPVTAESKVIAETTVPTMQANNPDPRPLEQKAIEQKKTDATKVEPRKTVRKPEIVKSDRSNLVPINMDDEIRRLAYLISERRGFQPGHEAEDWVAAEHEVRQRYHQQSA
jgi:hypothetical protein